MRVLRAWWAVVVLAGVLAGAAAAAASSPSQVVRVPAEAAATVDALGLEPVVDLDYGGFRWLELGPEDHARLVASGVAFEPVAEAGTVRVAGLAFDPVSDGAPSTGAPVEGADGAGLRLLQLVAPVRDEWVDELAGEGVELLQYYPHNTYLVWVDQARATVAATLPYVRWQGPFAAEYRVSPSLEGMSGVVRNVAVTFYNDGEVEGTLAALSRLGGEVVQHFPAQPDRRFVTAVVALDARLVPEAARIPAVWAVEYSSPVPGLEDEVATQITVGNTTGSPGTPFTGYFDWLAEKGVDGAGITWADVDTGLNGTHPDIAGRTPAYVSYAGAGAASTDTDGHGTHTAGAIFGDPRVSFGGTGIQDPSGFLWGVGTAPRAGMVIQNALIGTSWPPAGGWQVLSKDSLANGAMGSSNSWYTGASGAQGYSSAARTHDLMVRDGNFDTATTAEPLIMVFSAGNSGSGASTITEPKEAKNLIVVGATQNYRIGAINNIASFSSRGPALDGRLLPNVMAPGQQTSSWRGNSGTSCATTVAGAGATYYTYCSGTSMACPLVSGSAALIADWWEQEGWGVPSPAMVKALLVNGAVDIAGGTGVNGNIPNNNQGWGRVNLDAVIRNGLSNVYEDQQTLLTATGQSAVYTFLVPAAGQPAKVTLVWSDSAGAAGASPALVNNLDLVVVSGGVTYRGNVFSSGWSASGGTADTLNNVENVYIQSPGSDLTITVSATAVNGDGVPYNGDTTDQDFALVCTNCAEQADFTLAVAPSTQAVCAPADATFAVEVGSVVGFADPVDLAASGNPAGTTVGFGPTQVTPPGSSTLTVGSTGAAAGGSYPIVVSGTSTTGTKTATVTLDLAAGLAAAPSLASPADGALDQPLRPTFTWGAASGASSYRLQVARDAGFATVVVDSSPIAGTSHALTADLQTGTRYHWRVAASNGCGAGPWSAVFDFSTLAGPGDCGPGTSPVVAFSDSFEGGAPGWTHSAASGTDTWALLASPAPVHAGTYAYVAADSSSVSDQRLVSPAVALPSGQAPLTLEFWNRQEIEDNGTAACYDGAIAEISTNGGSTWVQLLDAVLLTDPYNGPVSNGYSNPLAGLRAWCGDPQEYLESVVNLDAYAGATVRFRFRVGTDSSTGRTYGWAIDDVTVQSCAPAGADLAVTVDDGATTATAGQPVTYTITVTNGGPEAATGAVVADAFPAALGTVDWSCAPSGTGTCTASGSGAINDTVSLPAGESLVYTAVGTLPPDATGTLSNTATVTAGGQDDPDPDDNGATDTDTIVVSADLAVTVTDGVSEVVAGTATTYAITVSNPGPSDAAGATVTDAFPAAITGVSWSCAGTGSAVCTASGSGDIADTVSIPAGEAVVYTAVAAVDPAATGTLSNSAAASFAFDPVAANNSSTDEDTVRREVEIQVAVTDGRCSIVPPDSATYLIEVRNLGPSSVSDAALEDLFPAVLSGVSWTCAATGGGVCPASGSGDITGTVGLPAGAELVYTATGTVAAGATGILYDVVTADPPAGVTDTVPGNNLAGDFTVIGPVLFCDDLESGSTGSWSDTTP